MPPGGHFPAARTPGTTEPPSGPADPTVRYAPTGPASSAGCPLGGKEGSLSDAMR